MSSPIRRKGDLDHSAHSPFTSPRQGRNAMTVKSKEAEDKPGYLSFLGDPKKSSSSPELSSPPAVPKGNHGIKSYLFYLCANVALYVVNLYAYSL